MKPSWRLGSCVVACLLSAIACGRKEAPPPATAAAPGAAASPPAAGTQATTTGPADTDWILVRLGDQAFTPNSPKQAQLRLVTGDKEAQGEATCTSFRSRFELDEAGLRFGPLQVTRKKCPKSALDKEKVFTDAIQGTSRWTIQGDRLVLSDASGKQVAEFVRRALND